MADRALRRQRLEARRQQPANGPEHALQWEKATASLATGCASSNADENFATISSDEEVVACAAKAQRASGGVSQAASSSDRLSSAADGVARSADFAGTGRGQQLDAFVPVSYTPLTPPTILRFFI